MSRDAELAAAIAAARAPRSCRTCGRLYIGAAYDVHFEHGPGSACLPGDARGQLEERDGAWVVLGSAAAGR